VYPYSRILSVCLFFRVLEAQQPPEPPLPPPAANTAPATERADSSDGQLSLSLTYLRGPSSPLLRSGRSNTNAQPSDFSFPKSDPLAGEATLSIPTGGHNTLRVSYLRLQGKGDEVTNENVTLFSSPYDAGDFLTGRYSLQSVNVTCDYLSGPFPTESKRLLWKTLWGVQYTVVRSNFNAPQKPSTDSDGNLLDNRASGSSSLIYPALGGGLEYFLSQHLRFEAKGTGFALPRRAATWDADAFLAYRAGRIEILVGGKEFHLKTSPRAEQYISGTLLSATVGLRWYFK
jgi:hypothetical protein